MKKILFCLLKIFASVTVIILLWLGIIVFYDPGLDSAFNSFMTTEKVDDKDNALFLFTGLLVSANEDSVKAGHQIIEGNYKGTSQSLNFSGQGLSCWTNQNKVPDKSDTNCMDASQLKKLISDNKIFLDRMNLMASYPRFYREGLTPDIPGTSGALVSLYRLKLASLSLLSEEESDDAIKIWLRDISFLKRVQIDRQYSMMKIMMNIPLALYLGVLPRLIDNHPEWAQTYSSQIKTVLEAPNINLENTIKADYQVLEPMEKQPKNFAFKTNDTRTQLLKLKKEIDLFKQKPLSAVGYQKYTEKAKASVFPGLGYNYVGRGFIQQYKVGYGYLLQGDLRLSAREKLLQLYLDAKAQKIPVQAANDYFLSHGINFLGVEKQTHIISAIDDQNFKIIYK